MLLLRGGGLLSSNAKLRLKEVFAAGRPMGKLQAVWKGKRLFRGPAACRLLVAPPEAKKVLKD